MHTSPTHTFTFSEVLNTWIYIYTILALLQRFWKSKIKPLSIVDHLASDNTYKTEQTSAHVENTWALMQEKHTQINFDEF